MDAKQLREIIAICDDAPSPRQHGSLADFQKRLDDFDERMSRIRAIAVLIDQRDSP